MQVKTPQSKPTMIVVASVRLSRRGTEYEKIDAFNEPYHFAAVAFLEGSVRAPIHLHQVVAFHSLLGVRP